MGAMGVSNHRRLDCLLNRLFRRRSKKALKLCVIGLCERSSPVAGEFPNKGPVTRKMFPFYEVIMEFNFHYALYFIMFDKLATCYCAWIFMYIFIFFGLWNAKVMIYMCCHVKTRSPCNSLFAGAKWVIFPLVAWHQTGRISVFWVPV